MTHSLAPCKPCNIWHCPVCGCKPRGSTVLAEYRTAPPADLDLIHAIAARNALTELARESA